MSDTAKAKSIVKPLVWDKQEAKTPYGTYRYELMTGAGPLNGCYTAILNFSVFIDQKRCDWPEIEQTCQDHHEALMKSAFDLTAYRKEVLEEAAAVPKNTAIEALRFSVDRPSEGVFKTFAEILVECSNDIRALTEKGSE